MTPTTDRSRTGLSSPQPIQTFHFQNKQNQSIICPSKLPSKTACKHKSLTSTWRTRLVSPHQSKTRTRNQISQSISSIKLIMKLHLELSIFKETKLNKIQTITVCLSAAKCSFRLINKEKRFHRWIPRAEKSKPCSKT